MNSPMTNTLAYWAPLSVTKQEIQNNDSKLIIELEGMTSLSSSTSLLPRGV